MRNPSCAATSVDVFSLGCLAYFLATGEHPPTAESGRVRVTSKGIDAHDQLRHLPPAVRTLIKRSTASDPDDRLKTATDFLHHLHAFDESDPAPVETASQPDAHPPQPVDVPADTTTREATPTECDTDAIETVLERRLGSGSAGTAYTCTLDGQGVVLKIANDASCDKLIDDEADALQRLDSPRIVSLHRHGSFQGRRAIAVDSAGHLTLGEMLRQALPLSAIERTAIADQLLQLGVDLEAADIVHGDLHPDHIGVAAPPGDLAIQAFDFSLRPSGSAVPGSLKYADPFFETRDILDAAADRYSIAAMIHAVLTGVPPGWGDGHSDPTLNQSITLRIEDSLSDPIAEFLATSLARNVADRPGSAEHLLQAWKKCLQKHELLLKAPPPATATSADQSSSDSEDTADDENATPDCPKCGSHMTIRRRRSDGNPFWGCTTYPRCKGTKNCEEADAEAASPALDQSAALQPTHQAPIELTIQHQDSSRFSQPMCHGSARRTAIKDSPSQGLETAKYVLGQPSTPGVLLPPLAQNVLCIVEKILTRGRVAPLSPTLEESSLACITDPEGDPSHTLAGQPMQDLAFGSEEERMFVEQILLPRLGPERMSCVTAQVNLSSLTNRGPATDRGERVDFVIADGDQVQVVIEVDGEQHEESRDYDADRDRRLIDAGWTVIRVPTAEVRSMAGPSIDAAIDAIGGCAPKRPYTLDDDVLSRCVQAQTALLDILRSSPNGCVLSVCIHWPDWTGVDTKSLTKAVVDDFNELTHTVGVLYDINMTVLEVAEDTCDRVVSFIGLTAEDPTPTWTIRDLHIPGRYTLRLRPAEGNPPTNADDDAFVSLLDRVYGFDEFREGQLEALSRGVLGKDSIVLLPTGAGKTVVFQLTCLLRPGPGIIVSPLIALMEDQLDNLERHGISNAGGITSAGSIAQREQVMAGLGTGSLLFAYVAPERFQMENFRLQLRRLAVQMPIACIAIDEAHCVSEWGHDFRTSYLNIARNARSICSHQGIAPPLLALTGTASRSVLRDVQRELEINDPDAIITPQSFDRKELQFRIQRCKSSEKSVLLQGILAKTAQAFNQDVTRFFTPKGADSNCCIIFTPHTNSKYGVFEAADAAGSATSLDVGVYSGKPPKGTGQHQWNSEKRRHADRFKSNITTLLASTKAFGMGVDKPNIRSTVHFNIPASIESLYQEAGRAGRDRQPSLCWVILSDETTQRHSEILDPRTPIEELHQIVDRFGYRASDDILRMLYFHLLSYKGIAAETQQVQEVLEQLEPINEPHTIDLPWRNRQHDLEKPLHRLLTIGVVSDYTVDYSKQEIRVDVHGASHEEITRSLHSYLSNFHRRAARDQAEELRESADTMSISAFAMDAAHRLTTFIYEHIEASRRRALTETLRICQAGLENEGEFRTRMLDYLQTSKFGKDVDKLCEQDQIDQLRERLEEDLGRPASDPEVTMDLCRHVLDLAESCENTSEAGHLRGEAARALTDFPDNAFLLLLRALAECMSARPKEQAIQEDAGKAMSLLAEDLPTDATGELIAGCLLQATQEQPQVTPALAESLMASVTEPYAVARALASRPEEVLQNAGQFYLIRNIRTRLDQLVGSTHA
ncbi:MAG: RecQ family ATP-dependent DNA helicase [Phycisphaerales bacterium]|nr:RecQ family ATP-dependent DNA helicase [Phycisphaerales bacterium]